MSIGFPLNRKETFAVSLVLFIGFFYILSLITAFFQTKSLPANRVFGLPELKFLFLGLFYWSGATAFFQQKRIGWVICTATLLNIILIVFRLLVTVSHESSFGGLALILTGCFILVAMGFLFLFGKGTRVKFKVNNISYLLTIGVYGLLLLITLML